jgi:hypothetical protein
MTKVNEFLNRLAIFLGLRSAVDYGNGKLAKACLNSALVQERRQALYGLDFSKTEFGTVPAPAPWIIEERGTASQLSVFGEVNSEGLTGSEVDALRLGKRIHTIKSVRLRTGLGLREAVTVIREIVADNPEYSASAEWSHKCDAYPSGTHP